MMKSEPHSFKNNAHPTRFVHILIDVNKHFTAEIIIILDSFVVFDGSIFESLNVNVAANNYLLFKDIVAS